MMWGLNVTENHITDAFNESRNRAECLQDSAGITMLPMDDSLFMLKSIALNFMSGQCCW